MELSELEKTRNKSSLLLKILIQTHFQLQLYTSHTKIIL
jgi:hypothetical protein